IRRTRDLLRLRQHRANSGRRSGEVFRRMWRPGQARGSLARWLAKAGFQRRWLRKWYFPATRLQAIAGPSLPKGCALPGAPDRGGDGSKAKEPAQRRAERQQTRPRVAAGKESRRWLQDG